MNSFDTYLPNTECKGKGKGCTGNVNAYITLTLRLIKRL